MQGLNRLLYYIRWCGGVNLVRTGMSAIKGGKVRTKSPHSKREDDRRGRPSYEEGAD